MSSGVPITYDDEWIKSRWREFKNWSKMCKAYNESHNSDLNYNTFKSHCNRELGINYHYSDEQTEWLKENYPKLGRIKCAERFNKKFREDRTPNAIRIYCEKLGLKVSEERKRMIAIENTKRIHSKGTVVTKTHGEPYIKTDSGWKRLKDIAYGEKPKGYIIVHLDGDVNNYDKKNLKAIPRSINARMTANGFWSSMPEITETGITCCTLEEVLVKTDSRLKNKMV